MKKTIFTAATLALGTAASAQTVVLPTGPHAFDNLIPFGSGSAGNTPTQHQVFDAATIRNMTGGGSIEIVAIGFARAGAGGVFNLGDVTISLGYTDRTPGVGAPTGLDAPDQGGGGAPNAVGAMTRFYDEPTVVTLTGGNSEDFSEMVFEGTPFVYDPSQGNLLVEIVVPDPAAIQLAVSRTAGSAESSRAYAGTRFGTAASPDTATRMEFTYRPGGTVCYPDCDGNETLDFFDFLCFQNAFLAGDPYADCDGNQTLDFFDFLCFQNEFLAGC